MQPICLSRSLRGWTIAAAAVACAGSAHADEACALVPAAAPAMPIYVEAVVLGPAPDADVLAQTRIAIERTHAPVSPAYVNLPRIDAAYRNAAGVQFVTIAAVISGPVPPRGAHVTLASRHRDPNVPCAFIPWTVAEKGSGT